MNGINWFGVGGLFAVLLGIFFFGRSSGKKSKQNEISKLKAEEEALKTQQKVGQGAAKASTDNARAQGVAKAVYDSEQERIRRAKEAEKAEEMYRLGMEQAKKAMQRGATRK